MDSIVLLLLYWLFAALAVYRMAYMMTADNGPAHVFRRIRRWAGNRWGEGSWQFEGATCFFCQSVWYSFPASIGALILFPTLRESVINAVIWGGVLWLSIAGAAQALHWRVLVWQVKVSQ